MKKNVTFYYVLLFPLAFSQVGIGTSKSQTIFRIAESGYNSDAGVHQANDFVLTSIGRLDIGNKYSHDQLKITSDKNLCLRIEVYNMDSSLVFPL